MEKNKKKANLTIYPMTLVLQSECCCVWCDVTREHGVHRPRCVHREGNPRPVCRPDEEPQSRETTTRVTVRVTVCFCFFVFFLKMFGRHLSFFVGPLIPRFGILVMSAQDLNTRVDSPTCMLCCPCTMDCSDSPLV